MVFPLLSLLVPANVDYGLIGSRAYMDAPNSDYDFLFHWEDRDKVLQHLLKLGVEYHGAMAESVKFDVEFVPTERFFKTGYNKMPINFCFTEDYDAWIKATEAMKKFARSQPPFFFRNMEKKFRILMFVDLVESFGGKRPLFPNLTS